MGTWKDSDEERQIEIVLYVYTRLCNEVWTGWRAQLGLLHSESMQWCSPILDDSPSRSQGNATTCMY